MTEKIENIIGEFKRNRDPKEIAKNFGFINQRELGVFMKEGGYVWDGEEGNYFKKEYKEEFVRRYKFKDKSDISNPRKNIIANEFSKIEVMDYHSIPLFLSQDIYRKLVVFIRENNLDYNKVIEDALNIYLK